MHYHPSDAELQTHDSAAQAVRRLLALMHRLRAPGGCPWDAKQTLKSLRPYLLEETFEVLEAIDEGDEAGHLEELGDLLLQIVFHAEIANEEQRFSLKEIADGIVDKLVIRHPHVFGELNADDAEEALSRWEEVKAKEKAAHGRPRTSVLDGVPKAAPALMRAERIGNKAASIGFDWRETEGVRIKLDEEIAELDEAIAAGDPQRIAEELGDLLFTAANLGRHYKVPPEDALRESVSRFEARFRIVEAGLKQEGLDARTLEEADLEARWQQAKRQLANKEPT